MIKLDETHRDQLLEFLQTSPFVNLFMIGDLDLYGFDDAIQEYYGAFEDDNLVAVFFRYMNLGSHLYATRLSDATIAWIKMYLMTHHTEDFLMGEATSKLAQGRLDDLFAKTVMTKLSVYTPNDFTIDTDGVQILKARFAQEITDIQLEAFGGTRADVSLLETSIANGETKVYGCFEGDELVAVGNYTAETNDAAMIIGVATKPEHREKGYASAVVKKMSDDLYAKGKQGVLFYDNPKAARIYERMGYTYHASYFMNELKK